MRHDCRAFTLVELVVSMAILTLITLIVSRMINSAAIIAVSGNRTMDSQSQIRPVLSRMTLDFAQMIKRPDTDYYRKSNADPQSGNDRIAFFCNSAGYYPSTGSQSPLSLVSYRINSNPTSASLNKMERMSKGLLWNGVTQPDTPMLFGLQAIVNNWPAAVSSSTTDSDYELIAPEIFRFEYYYVLKTGAISSDPGADGWQDIRALVLTLATLDEKSRVMLSSAQLNQVAAMLKDFDSSKPSYELVTSWQAALKTLIDIPRVAINGIRIYQRAFYLDPPK